MEPEIVALFMLAVVWVAVPAAGLWLLAVGLRGRVLDRRPRCRGCDYLLVGFRSRPVRCPECGAALQCPGNVVLGRRSPRLAVSILGTAMIVAGVGPLLVMAQRQFATVTVAAANAGRAPAAGPPLTYRSGAVSKSAMAGMAGDLEPVAAAPVETAPFTVHALFGAGAFGAGECAERESFTGPAPALSPAIAGRWVPPAGSSSTSLPAGLGGPAPLTVPRRPEVGSVPERRVGGAPAVNRIDPRRVEERRIRPWRHPLNSATPGR